MNKRACHEFQQRLLRDGQTASLSETDQAHAAACPDCQAVRNLTDALVRLGMTARSRDLSSRALADTRQRAAEMLAHAPHRAERRLRLLPLPRWTWAVGALAAAMLIFLRLPTPDPSVAPEPALAARALAPADTERNIHSLQHSLALDMRAFAERHRSPAHSSEVTDAAAQLRRQMDMLAFSVRLDMPDVLASAHSHNGGRP